MAETRKRFGLVRRLARFHLAYGEPSAAIAAVDNYLEYGNPEHPFVHQLKSLKAKALLQMEQYGDALREWNELVRFYNEIGHPQAEAYLGAGAALMGLKRFDEAREALLMADEVQSGIEMAKILLKRCDTEQQRADVEKGEL